LWEKIKSIFASIGGILLVALGYIFLSRKRTKTDVDIAKSKLEEVKKQTDEVVEQIVKAEQIIKQAQKLTDEEVEHAKDIEVPDNPDAVADALNDVLERVRGEGGGSKQQNCNGCAGRN